ncbi:MAG: response regulator transcription factor [Thermodesulfobacteriota bacterium]
MQQFDKDITVLLVDDHILVRYGMKAMLDRLPGFSCVGEAASGREGVDLSCELQPDIVVLDIDLGHGLNGFEAAQEIRQKVPNSKLLMLTGNPKTQLFQQGIQQGCDAYVLKVDSDAELTTALEAVARGEKYLSKSFTSDVFAILQRGTDSDGLADAPPLTPRERGVAQLIQRGLADMEIAGQLAISPKTVRVHKSNIKRKCGCRTTAELIIQLTSSPDWVLAGAESG